MRADSGPYLAADIAAACAGVLVSGDPETRFDGITTDSREIRKNDLFVPLKGPSFDGHDFLLPALEAGARGSLLDRDVKGDILQNPSKPVLIQVQDTLHSLSDLASAHRNTHSFPLIAVTGSSGKTTVKEMIAAVLGRSHRPLISEANFNNMIGLPMTVLNSGPRHTVAVVEAGINKSGEMEHLARAARPDAVVITTVGPVHLEGLGSVENVASEKFKLVRALAATGVAVLPAGDPYLAPLLDGSPCPVVSFGIESGDFRAANVKFAEETSFEMITPGGSREIRLPVPGRHNIVNSLAAAAASVSVGVSLDDVAEGLKGFVPPALRMEMVPLSEDRTLIRDCYNANPQSVSVALEILADSGRGHKTLALLADMKELGTEAEELHREAGRHAARLGIDRMIFVGDFGKSFREGFVAGGGAGDSFHWAADKEDVWRAIEPDLKTYGAVLVKGSRLMKMETIADRIREEN